MSLARTLTHTFVASLDTRRARQEFEFIASGASSASTDLHSLLIQLLAIRNLRVANLFSSWQHGCTLIMPKAEVGLASKSAAWCWKSKSWGIALRSISETRQKSLEQVSRSWTTRRDEKRRRTQGSDSGRKKGLKNMKFNFLQKQTSRREMLRGSATLAG